MHLKTDFNFHISELSQRGDKLISVFERDEKVLASYGIGKQKIGLLAQKTGTLKGMLSDEYFASHQMECTHSKNKHRMALENELNDLRNRAKLVYGANSIEYSMFKFTRIHNLSDSELINHSLHVVRMAESRLVKLAERQVSQTNLDEILRIRNLFDEAIDDQVRSISSRKEKSIERVQLANELYELISELCEVGKMIWRNKNEAFYTDYAIYGSSKAIAVQVEEEIFEEV